MSEFLDTIISAVKREEKTKPYDTTAKVTRIDGGTAWVHIDGGVDETPVKMTIDAAIGDTVQVRVGGGTAFLVGNETAPPTDDKTAIEARLKSIEANLLAQQAYNSANEAINMAENNASEFAQAVISINSDIDDLQNQIDGNITTWYYAYVPSLSNAPANTWTTDEDKNNHIGDLFYNSSTGYAYRFMLDGSTYKWIRISDEDIATALANAAAAQDTADHKRRVFTTTPSVPYDVGDLWCVGVSGDILTCTTAKTSSQSYSSSDWSKLNKYTDDTRADAAYTLASSAKTSADGKNTVYRQTSQPTGGTYVAGDIWFDSDDDNKIYRYNGSSWVGFTLGDDAIGNLNASHINAGTIDASVITVSNLDAGNITSGTLSTNRLNVNDIISTGSIIVSGDDISSLNNDSGYATTSDIPTNVSDLTNDSGYQTASDVSGAIVSTTTLYYASNSTTAPSKPSAHVTKNSTSTYGQWNIALPTYSSSYPYLYVCTETKTKGGTYGWTSVEQTSYTSAISAIKSTADSAAPKSDAVSRSQRIYYRKTSSGAPSANTTWLSTSGTGYGNWSLSIPQLTSGTTKYPYLYTAVQTQTVSQQAAGNTCSCSAVLLDDTTTVIDGGNIITGSVTANQIAANSISASRLALGEGTNLITASELYSASLPKLLNTSYQCVINSGYIVKTNAANTYMALTDYVQNNLKTGDELYYEFYAKSASTSSVNIGIWFYSASKEYLTYHGGTVHSLTTTEALYSGTISLTNATVSSSAFYWIGVVDSSSTKVQVYLRKAIVRRKSGGELIVDGSITTNKLAANAVTIGKINSSDSNTATAILNSSIDLGGRNRYSHNFTSVTASKFSFSKDASINGIIATRTASDAMGVVRLNNIIDDVNSYWTVSFDVKGTGSGTVFADICDVNIDTAKYPRINISSEYQHYVGCAKPTQVTSVYNFVDIDADTTVTGFTIKNLKVEKGNKPTDWTPAPEDVDSNISDAATKATDYITKIDNAGIFISPANQSPTTSAAGNSVKIDGTGMEVYKGGTSVAMYGDTGRVGVETSGHATVKSDGLHVWTGTESTASNEVAFFGSTSRIGKASGANGNVLTKSNGMDLRVGTTTVGSLTQNTTYTDKSGTLHNNALFLDAAQYFALRKGSSVLMEADDSWIDFHCSNGEMTFSADATEATVNLSTGNTNTSDSSYMSFTNGTGTSIDVGVMNDWSDDGGEEFGIWTEDKERWLLGGTADGYVMCPGIYLNTSSSGSNVRILGTGDPDYQLRRYVSSSRRYKKDIEDISDESLDPNRLYDARVVQFRYKEDYLDYNDPRYGKLVGGFIAEELEEVYPIAVQYEDEMAEDWEPKFLIPPMLKLIQDQKKKIDELEERIEALERK